MLGTVRRYNGDKGYGFIVAEGQATDIMFSRSDLPEDAREIRGNILEGRPVTFDAGVQADGRLKAMRVMLNHVEGAKVPGVVKSFSERNGYGFATSSCLSQDVRFSVADFQPAQTFPSNVNLVGALVLLEYDTQPDGKLKATRIQFQTSKLAQQYTAGAGGTQLASTIVPPPGAPPTIGATASFGTTITYGAPATYGAPTGLGATPGITNAMDPLSGLGMLQGTVKSFSERNGYGFINVPGLPMDIRFGKNDLVGEVISPGAPVQFKLAASPDGRLQGNTVIPMQAIMQSQVQVPVQVPMQVPVQVQIQPATQGVKRSVAPANHVPAQVQAPTIDFSVVQQPVKLPKTEPVSVISTGQWMSGTIKSYNPLKGWGLIVTPGITGGGGGKNSDVFFLKTNLPKEYRDTEGLAGSSVTYELMTQQNGQYRAQNVLIQ